MKNPSLWICETHSSADGKKTNGATPSGGPAPVGDEAPQQAEQERGRRGVKGGVQEGSASTAWTTSARRPRWRCRSGRSRTGAARRRSTLLSGCARRGRPRGCGKRSSRRRPEGHCPRARPAGGREARPAGSPRRRSPHSRRRSPTRRGSVRRSPDGHAGGRQAESRHDRRQRLADRVGAPAGHQLVEVPVAGHAGCPG